MNDEAGSPEAHSIGKMRRVRLGELHVHCHEAGPKTGSLLVLLHGFPESGRAWHKHMALFAAAGLHVLAPDMRGYGLSDAPHGVAAYQLSRLVSDIVELADTVNVERFSIAGHDWGGIIACALAAWHPGRVHRLIILNAPNLDTVPGDLRRHPVQLLRSFYAALFQIPVLPEVMLRRRRYARLRQALRKTALPGTFSDDQLDAYANEWAEPRRLTAMLNYYRALRLPREKLGRITVPTLIMWGLKDQFLGWHLAQAAAELCDDVQLVWFQAATHWIHHEEASRVADEVIRFMASTP